MGCSFLEAVDSFKRQWTKYLDVREINLLARESGLSWRTRKLDPGTTIVLFLLQILHGNTAIRNLPHLSGFWFQASAYCKARMRVPLSLFESLFFKIQEGLQEEDYSDGRWLGHRVFLADGTGVSMSDVPELKEAFGHPPTQKKDCGFPVAKLLAMLHFGTGMVTKVCVSPLATHDITSYPEVRTELSQGDLIVGDRAACAYHHICQLLQLKIHALFRIHARVGVSFVPGRAHFKPGEIPTDLNLPKSKWIASLGKKDQIVKWHKPISTPKSIKKEEYKKLPGGIKVREIEYRIHRKGFRTRKVQIVTTLLDHEKYPAKKIAEIYKFRWQIETNFNHLKTTMKMDVLKSKTPDGIKKELLTYFIVYNLVRLVMLKAAKKKKVTHTRISFIDALRWLISPNTDLKHLTLIPIRPDRLEPRCIKRRTKAYPYMINSRTELRKKKLSQIVKGRKAA